MNTVKSKQLFPVKHNSNINKRPSERMNEWMYACMRDRAKDRIQTVYAQYSRSISVYMCNCTCMFVYQHHTANSRWNYKLQIVCVFINEFYAINDNCIYSDKEGIAINLIDSDKSMEVCRAIESHFGIKFSSFDIASEISMVTSELVSE